MEYAWIASDYLSFDPVSTEMTLVRAIDDFEAETLSTREQKELRQISMHRGHTEDSSAQTLSMRKGDLMLILPPIDLGWVIVNQYSPDI